MRRMRDVSVAGVVVGSENTTGAAIVSGVAD